MKKQIKDMNLAECIGEMRDEELFYMTPAHFYSSYVKQLADRIHQLTRWIPVGEETIPDGKLLRVKIKNPEIETFGTYYNELGKWMCAVYGAEVTHYQTMTFPEDKP